MTTDEIRCIALALGTGLLLCGSILWRISDAIPYCRSIALGDLDGNGDLDAFVGNEGPDEVWLNDGTGSFSNSGQTIGDAHARTWHVTLGDVDRDGDLDALVERQAAAEIWLNDGGGIFVDSERRLSPLVLCAVALGDVDGDGDLDTVMGEGAQAAQGLAERRHRSVRATGRALGLGSTGRGRTLDDGPLVFQATAPAAQTCCQ